MKTKWTHTHFAVYHGKSTVLYKYALIAILAMKMIRKGGETMNFFVVLSVVLAIAIATAVVYIMSPKSQPEKFYVSDDANLDPTIKKAMNLIGGDLLAIIPKDMSDDTLRNTEIDDLMRASGNPWEVSKVEFLLLRGMATLGGLILGIVLAFGFEVSLGFGVAMVVGFAYIGWIYPLSKYKSLAKEREDSFKMELPEAIDYLAMTMSAGDKSLQNAFTVILDYLQPSVVRDELELVAKSINAGQTMEASLEEMARRVPNEGIASFVNALNNANKNNVPIDTILKNRAEASRKDLDLELEKKIERVPYLVLGIIGPVAFVGLLIVTVLPSILSIIGIN